MKTVKVKEGVSALLLPDGGTYDANAVVTLSDSQYENMTAHAAASVNVLFSQPDVSPLATNTAYFNYLNAQMAKVFAGAASEAPIDISRLPVGTTSGTVAAGDDSRFSGGTILSDAEAYTDSQVSAEQTRALAAEALLAPKASPALTGTPTTPTASALTNTTQIASTAYADAAVNVEKTRAQSAETTLTTNVASNASAISAETTRATSAEGSKLSKASNLSDLPDVPTSRTNLGLGTAAVTDSSAYDAAGTSAAETTRATAAEALKAPLASPALTGNPTAPTQTAGNNSTRLATTAYTDGAVATETTRATSAEGTNASAISAETTRATNAEALLAPLASPHLTGIPTAPTATAATNTTQIATTAYTDAAVTVEQTRALAAEALKAPLASPAFTGTPTAPTAAAGTNTTQLATTAYADRYQGSAAGTASRPLSATDATTTNARTPTAHHTTHESGGSDAVTLAESQVTNLVTDLSAKAPLASPAFTGTPTAPTAAALTNTTQVSTTAYTDAAVAVEVSRATSAEALKAPLASPALTGTPTVPTATAGTNTTQAASTAFVTTAVAGGGGGVPPTRQVIAGTGLTGGGDLSVDRTFTVAYGTSGTTAAVGNDSRIVNAAPLASPALTGTPTAPTAAASTNTTQIATTAYADAAVLVEKTRALAAEALLAPLASPALTGNPTATTQAAGNNSIRIATTAFVATSFAPLASPTFSGTMTMAPKIIDTKATQTLASNGAVTIDASTGDAVITLQANATSSSITNPTANQILRITWIQDATGGRTYAWPSNVTFASATGPSDTTANGQQTVTVRYDSTATKWIEVSRAGSDPAAHAATHASGGSDPVTLAESQITNLTSDLAAKAPLASPTFTGTPAAPTATAGTNTTQVATTAFVTTAQAASIPESQVTNLTTDLAAKAPLASPALTGTPTAPTASGATNNTQIATTAYTTSAVGVENTRAVAAEALLAPLASPALTGTPTAPTAAALTNTTQIATTAYADRYTGSAAGTSSRPLAATDSTTTNSRTPTAHASTHASAGSDPVTLAESQVTNLTTDLAAKAPTASPTFTGTMTMAPKIINTKTAQTLASNGAVTIDASVGDAVITLQANATSSSITNPTADQILRITWIQDATGGRTYAWPTTVLWAAVAAPTADVSANGRQSATFRYDSTATKWVELSRSGEDVPSSRTITAGTGLTGGGTLAADRTLTVAYGSSSTTAAVGNDARLSDARTPTAHASTHASGGSDPVTLAESQITNLTSDLAAKAPLASPALTGTPTAPTATVGTNTTQIATTAFVLANGGGGGVPTSRQVIAGTGLTGGGDLTADRTFTVAYGTSSTTAAVGNDSRITGAAPTASPALTGTPTAPTASAANNSTQIATTAYVDSADALQANLASPTFTGTPTAPTATASDNTTTLATTAFVYATPRSKITRVTVAASPFSFVPDARTVSVDVMLIGAGGGGGGGARQATAVLATGGAGGAGGNIVTRRYPISAVSNPTTVTVGAGGTLGAAATGDTTVGSAGLAGGQTSFGSLIASPGGGGNGGTAAGAATGGTKGVVYRAQLIGSVGASSSATGAAGTAAADATGGGAGGGGAGGGMTTGNAQSAGGDGGQSYGAGVNATGTGGAVHVSGTTGNPVGFPDTVFPGSGGGGGGSGLANAAGSGANGGGYGGGAGGGGASRNGFAAGAGGTGADGSALITEWF